MIEIDNLSKSYDNDVVLNIPKMSIPKSQIFGLVGNNGAGKTTVFNCLTGFYKATAGSMFLNKENERLNLKRLLLEVSELNLNAEKFYSKFKFYQICIGSQLNDTILTNKASESMASFCCNQSYHRNHSFCLLYTSPSPRDS